MIASRPRKLLYVIANSEYGGGEDVFLNLSRSFDSKGYDVVVCASPGGRFQDELEKAGIRFLPVDFSLQANPLTLAVLADIMKREKPDIVHSQGRRVDFYAALVSTCVRIPVRVSTVAMLVEGFDVGPVKKALYLFVEKLFERRFSRIMVVSEKLKRLPLAGCEAKAKSMSQIKNCHAPSSGLQM